jgi:outer membrane immunogenic protein
MRKAGLTHTALAAISALIAASSAASAQTFDRPGIWSGFYGGANLGYGWGEMTSPGSNGAIKPGGIIGGLHAGYNYQMSNVVIGVEGDYDFSKVSKSGGDASLSAVARFNSTASLRGRLGYAFDRTLVYGTLGYGWTDAGIKVTDSVSTVDYRRTFGGLVYGGGLEYKFTGNVSLRGEVLRFNSFGNLDFGGGDVVRVNTPVTQFRMGLSYHF